MPDLRPAPALLESLARQLADAFPGDESLTIAMPPRGSRARAKEAWIVLGRACEGKAIGGCPA